LSYTPETKIGITWKGENRNNKSVNVLVYAIP